MKKKILYLFLPFLMLFFSCAQKIVSNKAADYNKKPKKIFVLTTYSKDGKAAGDEFSFALQQQFKLKNIACTGYEHDELSLDTEEDINKKISAYAPEGILSITQTGTDYNSGDGIFLLTLIDAQTKKSVWKSIINVSVSGIYHNGSLPITVNSVVKKLIVDGLI
jgi:hypothetical protein